MLLSTLIIMNATPLVASSPTTPIVLPNLPKTCLPVKGRMLPIGNGVTDSDHRKCHCPPLAMCTQTVSYNGVTYPKLPGSVSGVCCPEPQIPIEPPPTPTPTQVIIPPKKCEVHYYKSTSTACAEKTFIGTRIGGYCSQYTVGTNPGGGSSGNTCVQTCSAFQTRIDNLLNQIASLNPPPNSVLYQQLQAARTRFVNCTQQCTNNPPPSTSPLAARVTSLNTCLKNTCQPIKTKISNINKTTGDFLIENLYSATRTREKAEMQAQIWLKDYVICRRTCFDTNNFNNGINNKTDTLMQQSEIDLNKWIMLDLSDDVTDLDVNTFNKTEYSEALKKIANAKGGAQIYDFLNRLPRDAAPLKYFTAKTYGPLVNVTINQKDQKNPQNQIFDWFFQNTYHPVKSGVNPPLNFSYLANIGIQDKTLGTSQSVPIPIANGTTQDQSIYFKNMIAGLPSKFKNLDTITNEHGRDYVAPSWNGITCAETTFFGMCITTWSNDGSCISCLSPETKITMADNTTKAIKDLKMGDTVKAPYGQTAVIDEVVNIKWPKLELYNINDGQLRLTADHPIMTTNGWRAINYDARKDDSSYKRYGMATVAELKIGDVIVTENGDIPVTRIMPDPVIKDGETFNLKLRDNIKAFYANGILVKSNE